MRECERTELRDLLPELERGTLASADHERMEAHVAACDACRTELALLRAVRGAHPAPSVDVARIVAALPRPQMRPGMRPALHSEMRPLSTASEGVVSLDAHRARRAATRVAMPWRRVAAIAAVLVGVVTVGVVGTRDGGQSRVAAPVASAGQPGATTAPETAATPAPTPATGAGTALATPAPRGGESARALPSGAAIASASPRAPRAADALGSLGGVTSDVTDAELEALIAGLESLSGIPVIEESETVEGAGGQG